MYNKYFGKMYVDGAWVSPVSDDMIQVENPYTHEILARVPACQEEDVNRAVKAAKGAFILWSKLALEERITYMEAFQGALIQKRDALISTVMAELGVNEAYARRSHVDCNIEAIAENIAVVRSLDFWEERGDLIVSHEPFGVIACLTPWNYPMGQMMSKLIPALLTGNTVVLKPSQLTPLTAYVIFEAIEEVGFPQGVANLLPGRGAEVGNALAKHPDVSMVSFTGSTKGGEEVYTLAAKTGKKVVLELGGKSAAIVWDPEYFDKAAKSVLSRVYNNVGQTCSAWTRLLVPRKYLAEMEAVLKLHTARYEFGDPTSGSFVIGPLVSKKQFDKVTGYIAQGLREGATLLVGQAHLAYRGSYAVGPTIFSNVRNDMVIAQEEIFGPVLCVIPFETLEEGIEMANDNSYGLSGAVFGPAKEAMEVAKALRTGEVSINGYFCDQAAPFGGFSHSGIGREGGEWGIKEYLQVKAIHVPKA